jgi:hypothetical protein
MTSQVFFSKKFFNHGDHRELRERIFFNFQSSISVISVSSVVLYEFSGRIGMSSLKFLNKCVSKTIISHKDKLKPPRSPKKNLSVSASLRDIKIVLE